MILMILLLVYSGIVYYLGRRGWQGLSRYMADGSELYWGILIFLAAAYFLGRLLNQYSPGKISDALIWIGAYWMGFFFYALLTVLVVDVLRILNHVSGIKSAILIGPDGSLAAGIVIVLLLLMLIGSYNSRRPVLRKYQIVIPAPDLPLQQLKAVLVSDIHLGNIVGRDRLAGLVKKINQQEADIVFMAGDIIDGDARPFYEKDMALLLRQIKSRYGIFAVLGNHEYLGGQYKEMIAALKSAGIKVLRDEAHLVENSLYILGRDDKFSYKRKNLAELMQGLEKDIPVLVLDHNPVDIAEAEKNQVDVQFSGHTHTGQLWPLNYITAKIFATDWGYLRKGKLQVIVSNGYATWGPPIRIGNRPELVEVMISFR